MTCDIGVVVEGRGETAAVPVLLRRIAGVVTPGLTPRISVLRRGRQQVVKSPYFEESIDVAARRVGPRGLVLVLLDADIDCPAELGPQLIRRAAKARPDRTVRVVLAKAEYEAWFLASAGSLAGRHGFRADMSTPANPESIRDAKGWLSRHRTQAGAYRPTAHQASLTATFDMGAARSAPSFDKLWRDMAAEFRSRWDEALGLVSADGEHAAEERRPQPRPGGRE